MFRTTAPTTGESAMTKSALSEEAQLQMFGIRSAHAGSPKPTFEAWTVTFGAGEHGARAYDAYCQGFDEVRASAWERTKRELVGHRVTITVPARTFLGRASAARPVRVA